MSLHNKVQPVAVVGIAVRLPSGELSDENLDYHSLWSSLVEKKDAYGAVPAERLEGMVPGFSVNGTFLKQITKFDNIEFGIGNKDAKSMVMSNRHLIELSFLAALDSGIQYRGKRFGSFMCGTSTEHFDSETTAERTIATPANTLANRVSYVLDITGPSLFLDTACSSSLTAIHLALQAIQNGECEGAFVGGCQLNTNLFDWGFYSEGGITSPDFKCKPFDAGANGFAQGEGVVVVVLKKLEAALSDNDHIYSVFLGSSINSNGGRASLHAPSAIAHQECILEAFARAGRSPKEVDFVELHATGTSVGDPIEANAAGELFAREDEVLIGSLKGNIGHLESTAFLASLAKVCLMIENRVIPPNAHFNTPNPKVMWEKYCLRVPTESIPLGARSSTGRPLISMASSGIGGSNGHVVIEGPPSPLECGTMPPETPVLFVIGGLSPKTVQSLSESVIRTLTADSSPEALSQAVRHARRARQLPWRTHFSFVPGARSLPTIPTPVLTPKLSPPIIMVFTGQGPQHIDMGRSLFRSHKIFRDSILEMDKIYDFLTGSSFVETTGLFDGRESSLLGVWPVEVTLPALTMVQIALFDLLSSIGIKPAAVLGHSAGETAMIYASGAGSKTMALEVAIARAKGMKVTESIGGGMAALGCDMASARGIIERVKQKLSGILEIACYNSPEAYVISGDGSLVDAAVELAQKEDVFARRIQTQVPSHSSITEICRDTYLGGMEQVFLKYPQSCAPSVPAFSTVAGQPSIIAEYTPESCWQNLRSPVCFEQAIAAVLEQYPQAVFIEVSPHPALSAYISATGQHGVVCPMQRKKAGSSFDAEAIAFTGAIGTLMTLGVNTIDLTPIYGRANRSQIYDIPYPFTARYFPMRIDGPREMVLCRSEASAFRVKMNSKTHPDLAQHVINGTSIMPATGLIDLVLQAGARVLWDIEFNAILSLESESPIEVRVQREHNNWSLVTSQANDIRTHSKGLCGSILMASPLPIDLNSIRNRLSPIDLRDFYGALLPLANFGPIFRRITYLAGGYDEVFAEIDASIESHGEAAYTFNPVLLDACLHFALHPSIVQSADKDTIFLPNKLGRFIYYRRPEYEGSIYSHLRLVEWTPATRVYDINIYDGSGKTLCSLHRLELREVSTLPPVVVNNRYDLIHQPVAINQPITVLDEPLSIYDEDERDLHHYLDVLSQEIIIESLKSNPEVASELHRQRYFEFAEKAAARVLDPAPSAERIDYLRSKFPENFEITERLRPIHSQTFDSSAPAVEALFTDDLMSRFYGNFFLTLLEYNTRAFNKIVSAMVGKGKRALKVLEAGAGTGMLTRCLTNALEERKDVVAEYYVTDISFALASSAAKTCSYRYNIPKTYDLSNPVEEQGFTPGSFDIVTAFHVLHATPDISETLASLRSLLAPGGCLLIIELDGNSWNEKAGTIWHDFVFGCFAEWYGFSDGREHCIMSPQQWESSLHDAGFTNTQSAVDLEGSLAFTYTAQKLSEVPLDSVKERPDSSFFTYKYGQENRLRQHLAQLEINQPLSIWLLASEGPDGHAGAGMIATLARELSQWNLHLAVFPTNFSNESERIHAISRHWDYLTGDQIVHFDTKGNPSVAKVVPSLPPPAQSTSFDPAASWSSDGVTIMQSFVEDLGENQVTVKILAWSREHCSWRGFVGTVTSSRFDGLSDGNHVLGITAAQLSNHILCDAESLAQISEASFRSSLAEDVLPMLIGVSALGATRVANAARSIRRTRIFVPESTKFNQMLVTLFSQPQLNTEVTSENPSSEDRFGLIVLNSSSAAANPHFDSWLQPRTGKTFIWDSWLQEQHEQAPWNIGYALSTALERGLTTFPSDTEVVRPVDLLKTLAVKSGLSIFRSNKAYIVLGGASDLGVFMALWMYKNGARNIILNSRRGLRFFEESATISTKQRFGYLRSQSGLQLRVEAFDATSADSMSILATSIKVPVGGCLVATLILMDGLFMGQTPEKFSTVADLKLKVFEAFASAFDVAKLDFIISLSSMMSIAGNSGQTSYAAGCGLLDGTLAQYPNAFSVILPGISLLGYLDRVQSDGAHNHLDRWSLTPDEMCAAIGDGILKLAAGDRCSYYIPDLPWAIVEEDTGLPPSCSHLVARNVSTESNKASDNFHRGEQHEILGIILNLLDIAESDFSPVLPFTSFGLDSLGATRISQALRPYVSVSQMQLLGGITWEHLLERMEDKIQAADASSESPVGKVFEMTQMAKKYCQDFAPHSGSVPLPEQEVILITGTTGSIGAHVLADFLALPSVSKVYALNRKNHISLLERQRDSFRMRGLDVALIDSSKLVLLEADVTQPDFALPVVVLHELRTITHIIHIGWRVDFNMSLEASEDQFKGVRNLIDFALLSPFISPPRLLFVSSPAILRQYFEPTPFPEEAVKPELAVGLGYGEAKWVAEKIISVAASETSLRPIIVRPGQVGSSNNGCWKASEWIPSIILSANALKCLPSLKQEISIIPASIAAAAVVEIRNSLVQIIHIRHNHPVQWDTIFTHVSEVLGVPLVSWPEWISRLEKSEYTEENVALRLLDHYKGAVVEDPRLEAGLPRIGMDIGRKESSVLADPNMRRVGVEDAQSWLEYWKFSGFIYF